MKIILHEEMIGLGEEGTVVEVSAGYARNYLFPQKKAIAYNKKNISLIESQRIVIEKRRAERLKHRMNLKEKLEAESITIKMNVGDNGKLFGAVTSQVIIGELEKKEISLLKRQVNVLEGTIKQIGKYTIDIRLSQDIVALLSLTVTDMDGNSEIKETKNVRDEKKNKRVYKKDASLQEGEEVQQESEPIKQEESISSETIMTVDVDTDTKDGEGIAP